MSATEEMYSLSDNFASVFGEKAPEDYLSDTIPDAIQDGNLNDAWVLAKLRDQAWYGQRAKTLNWDDPRNCLALPWLRFLLFERKKKGSMFCSLLLDYDFRIYPAGEANNSSFSKILPWLKDRSKISYIELEIALVIFDWWRPKPQFAPWVFSRPSILASAYQYLHNQYCFPLISAFGNAKQEGKKAFIDSKPNQPIKISRMPDLYDNVITKKLTEALPSVDGFGRIATRNLGIIAIGFAATLGMGPCLDFFWYGSFVYLLPFTFTLWMIISGLIFQDVRKKTEYLLPIRKCLSRSLMSSAWLFFLGSLLVGSCHFILLTGTPDFQYVEAAGKPEPQLTLCIKWLSATLSCTATAVLMGMLIQWIWGKESIVEPL